MTPSLNTSTFLITGGTSGIGLAVAQRLVDDGAHVVITGRRPDALEEATARLGSLARGIVADSAAETELDELFAGIRDQEGRLDGVVVNAGAGSLMRLADVTWDEAERAFAANVHGATLTVQKSLGLLGSGSSIVLTGSTLAEGGAAGFGLYAAAKAALRALARTWAVELAERGIRVNQVVPGPTHTAGLAGLVPGDPQPLLDALAASMPLGRLVRTQETAEAVLFLLSSTSSAITGSELFVDGGEAHYRAPALAGVA